MKTVLLALAALVSSAAVAEATVTPVIVFLSPGQQTCFSTPGGVQCLQYIPPWCIPAQPCQGKWHLHTFFDAYQEGAGPQCYKLLRKDPGNILVLQHC